MRKTTSKLRLGRRNALLAVCAAAVMALGAGSAQAATSGTWTSWNLNPASGCSTTAQVPSKTTSGQITARTAVYCPRGTWLTVRARLRSDRSFGDDITVAQNGCYGSSSCYTYVPAATVTYYSVTCPKTSKTVNHGYHSDIIIYPNGNLYSLTNSTSGSVSGTVYCAA